MKKKSAPKQRKKQVKTEKNRHTNPFSYILIAVLLVSVFSYPTVQRFYQPLAHLDPPARAQISLPDPLELSFISTSVLGAQTIEPTDVVKYVNIERAKIGAPSLRLSPKLMTAAQKRADVILKYQNFSHQDPYENIELVTVLPQVNYYYRYASENIGMGGISAEDFVGGFMHSTSHRENLLNANLSDTGVAVVSGPFKQYYVNIAVQLFAIPGSQEDVLGYKKEDVENYKSQLALVNAKINPLFWEINRLIDPNDFSDENRRKLARQKEILENVYSLMKENKPLGDKQVAMILEYNNTL